MGKVFSYTWNGTPLEVPAELTGTALGLTHDWIRRLWVSFQGKRSNDPNVIQPLLVEDWERFCRGQYSFLHEAQSQFRLDNPKSDYWRIPLPAKSMSDVACDLDAVAQSWDATSYLQNIDLRKRWEVKAPVLHQRDAEGLGGAKRRTDDNLRRIFG